MSTAFGAVGILLLLFGLVVVASFVLWIWALVDALGNPDSAYAATGQSKILWVLVIVFLHALGALLYLAIARPQLRRRSPAY